MAQRADYWQEYVTSTLVGIDCVSADCVGLDVTFGYSRFGSVAVAELHGNRHSVERNQQRIRRFHKNSVFVCFQLQGTSYVLQGGDCVTMEAGDLLCYETSTPYVHGSATDIHTLILDIPIDALLEQGAALPSGHPIKLSREKGLGRLFLSALLDAHTQARPDNLEQRKATGMQLLNLVQCVLRMQQGQALPSRAGSYRVLQAKAFIEDHLAAPHLDAEAVARAVDLSSRQLNRLFEQEQTTISRFIWSRRLERARADLLDPAQRHRQVAEIAFCWGFASAAHFSRAYRARYGISPLLSRRMD
ncbi:MAG TPA: helix-turn-helix domain-containing protein [Rhodocyclaceae bacterium]|nr:helix-turn-helix domain-containing protein [Rhodocyclaceae bacterium]